MNEEDGEEATPVSTLLADWQKQALRQRDFLSELEGAHNYHFHDVHAICTELFGEPRVRGSHYFFRTPWRSGPIVMLTHNRQDVKQYQIVEIRKAIRKLQTMVGAE